MGGRTPRTDTAGPTRDPAADPALARVSTALDGLGAAERASADEGLAWRLALRSRPGVVAGEPVETAAGTRGVLRRDWTRWGGLAFAVLAVAGVVSVVSLRGGGAATTPGGPSGAPSGATTLAAIEAEVETFLLVDAALGDADGWGVGVTAASLDAWEATEGIDEEVVRVLQGVAAGEGGAS